MKKLLYVSVFFISAGAGLFLGGGVVYADTQVPSDVSSDMTWSLDGSPYVVSGDTQVVPGVTITIDPGVSVKFTDSSSVLTVLGDMHANGTAAQPVTFSPMIAGQDWLINFIKSTSTLSYVNINGSHQPIFGMNTNIKIDHLVAKGLAGPLMFNNSTVDIAASDFGNGARLLELFKNSAATVRGSTFHDVTDDLGAIAVYNSASLSIATSTIERGSTNGIAVYSKGKVILQNTQIKDFGKDGIVAYSGAQVSLDHSVITGNAIGLEIYSPITFHATLSDIYGNTTSAISNISGSLIDATNLWWGDVAGPGSMVSGNVAFDPWLTADPLALPKCCSSIAFLPGLEGSRLYVPATLFGQNQLWEPNINADVEKLYLDSDGHSLRGDIYTKDIIDETKIGGLNIYKNFEQSMDALVSGGIIKQWKALPYDWRKDVNDLVAGGTVIKNDQGDFDVLNFTKEIEHIAASSTTGKATIVAHSNGGLITKLVVQELVKRGEGDLVDKVILVAVPELGTPKSIPALLHGFDQNFAWGWILKESVARGLGQNMESAYGLLPSQEYFNHVEDPVVVFDSLLATSTGLKKYGASINTFDKLQNFILGYDDVRTNATSSDIKTPIAVNKKLLDQANITHTDLDMWQFPENISVSQVVGWGLDTLSGTKYVMKKECNGSGTICDEVLDEQPIFTNDGDNTVVTPSASAVKTSTYYVNLPAHNNQLFGLRRNRGHADILEIDEVQQLVKNIVIGTSTVSSIITTIKPQGNSNKSLHISVHSPVSLDAYDEYGNHTGLITNPDPNSDIQMVEENIPNSSYVNFGEGKYVNLPASANTNIQLQGLGYGTFTLNLNSVTDTVAFTDIPITPLSSAHIEVSATTTPQIALDIDGDGKDDYILSPSDSFDPILYLNSMRQIVISFQLKKAVEKDLLAKIDKILELIKKGKITKAESKIEKVIIRTEKKKTKKIDDVDKQQFISSLTLLLNSIN